MGLAASSNRVTQKDVESYNLELALKKAIEIEANRFILFLVKNSSSGYEIVLYNSELSKSCFCLVTCTVLNEAEDHFL